MYFRLSDADRERFGGPEWVELDPDALLNVPASQLAQWEAEFHPLTVLQAVNGRNSAAGLRALMWLARKFVGVEEQSFSEFDPAVLAAKLVQNEPSDSGKSPGSPPSSEDSPDPAAP
jgi:hypothetical protein